ncbi:ArsR/SmtB family transcription factor [Brevibacillus sp. H7]|uniref:ArsR/SmtB family transcription factor n=1 Tax=Brevibacillus sp. H7 TaxID=3349138 RepID=UPI0038285AAB
MTYGRTTYRVEFACSPLFETALGIAAATYPQIYPTLEKPASYWEQMITALPPAIRSEVHYAQKHNTWKTLLQLLQQEAFGDLGTFLDYVKQLDPVELRRHSLPYLGTAMEETRSEAAGGDRDSAEKLIRFCRGHKFFPAYIRFVSEADVEELRRHLTVLMEGWYRTHVEPMEEDLRRILERDVDQKQTMQSKLSPEDLVEWATGGIQYPPEPGVMRVLLIPHAIYRPWNIQADAEQTKIFYFPVSDESLYGEIDPYRPPQMLVQSLKALGDEHRLRIVRLLAEQDRSLQELKDKLALAKSTVHHHLSMLRSAQLVTVSGDKYALKPAALDRLPALWQRFLQRPETDHA